MPRGQENSNQVGYLKKLENGWRQFMVHDLQCATTCSAPRMVSINLQSNLQRVTRTSDFLLAGNGRVKEPVE